MADVPARRIDRDALERILQRAAELQAREIDTADGLTEQELLKLGAEVGIDGRFLRQALYEERAGAAAGERGFLARWIGPRVVTASRVVPGDRAQVEQAIEHWMTDGEALAVKRRLPDRTVWERQRGFFAEMKRGFGVGGRSYVLAKRAGDVSVGITQLEPGYCHVEMSADLGTARGEAATGAAVGAAVLGAAGLGVLTIPVAATGAATLLALAALVPLVGAVSTPMLVSRAFRRRSEAVQVALEQVLDRLERHEIRPNHRTQQPSALSALGKIADEVRRAITEAAEPGRSGPRRRLPGP